MEYSREKRANSSLDAKAAEKGRFSSRSKPPACGLASAGRHAAGVYQEGAGLCAAGGLLLERYDREQEHRDFPGSGGRRRGAGALGLPVSDHDAAERHAADGHRVRTRGISGSLASAFKERSPDSKPGLPLRFRLPPLCRKDVLESTRS